MKIIQNYNGHEWEELDENFYVGGGRYRKYIRNKGIK